MHSHTPPGLEVGDPVDAEWLKYLPGLIRRPLMHRSRLQAMLSNSGWLLADRSLRLGVGLVIGVWIARYLGPTQYGLLNYASAFAYLFSALASLGLDSVVVRELANNPDRSDELLGSAFVLKLVGGLLSFTVTVVAALVLRHGERLVTYLIVLSAFGFVFQAFNVIDFFFQSRIQSRYTVLATNAAFLGMTLVRLALLLSSATVVAFAWAALGELVLSGGFLMVAYISRVNRLRHWRVRREIARNLLRDSWPLMFSSLAVSVFMKIDQVMLESLASASSVGIYSAAVRVSEIWYFGAAVVVSTVAPAIYRARKESEAEFRMQLQRVFNTMLLCSIAIIAVLSLAAAQIIHLLFGPAYAAAAGVLLIHTWSTLFVFMGSAQAIYWVAENLQFLSLVLTVTAAVINILLNLVLIPRLGATGAAIATLVSYGVPTIILPVFFARARPVFFMFFKAFNPSSYV